MIDFPSSPTNGQVYANYIWDSSITAWRNVNTDTGIGTLNAMGLKNVVPTSIAVGSGSATVNSNGTVTFSGATSISFNGIFTSSYKNYKIILSPTVASANMTVYIRFRRNGTDDSSASYYAGGVKYNQLGTGAALQSNGGTSPSVLDIGSSYPTISNCNIDVFNPYTTSSHKSWMNNFIQFDSNYTWGGFYSGTFANTNTHDGFSFFTSTGNFTGTIQVFGYTN